MISLVSITYNCAKELQNNKQVARIYEEGFNATPSPPDYIVLSLQEVAPIHNASFGLISEYLQVFLDCVPCGYQSVGKSVCGAIVCLVFRSETAAKPLTVTTAIAKFGLLWSSLKGAALVSLQFENGSNLHLISAHLAAGQNQLAARNFDFNYFYDKFQLQSLPGQLIVNGDLNYRTVDGTFDTDELRRQMARKTIPSLDEADVSFGPTYKYTIDSTALSYERISSFCDRILYRNISGVSVYKYSSIDYPFQSDHRPVFLSLTTPLNFPVPSSTSFNEYETPSESLNSADLLVGSVSYFTSTSYGRLILVLLSFLMFVWLFI